MTYQLLLVLGIVIILSFVVLMNKRTAMHDTTRDSANTQQMIAEDPITVQTQTLSTSDEVDSIDADLRNTNIDALDQ